MRRIVRLCRLSWARIVPSALWLSAVGVSGCGELGEVPAAEADARGDTLSQPSAPGVPSVPERLAERAPDGIGRVDPTGRPITIGTFAGTWDAATGAMRVWSTTDRGALSSCVLDVASDGTPGTNPPDTVELYTEDGTIAEDESCWFPASGMGPSEFGIARAICGQITVRNFWDRPFARVWAQVDAMQPTGVTGFGTSAPPPYDSDGELVGGFGRWDFSGLSANDEAGDSATVQWTFERPVGVTQFGFSGRVMSFEDELCNGLDDDCDGEVDTVGGLPVTQTCWEGPPGVENLGVCSPGVATCGGGAWGSCVGQVLPSSEVCDGQDNDCDGVIDEGGVCLTQVGGSCSDDAECATNHCSGSICSPGGFQFIPGGAFTIGSPTTEAGRYANETRRSRTVSSFFLKSTEVTQGEWVAAGYTNPSDNAACGATCPVERVNWWEALHFANHRSDAELVTSCYTLSGCNANAVGADRECTGVVLDGGTSHPAACRGYRLPTEAEWEYAYRAGTYTAFYNGNITQPTGNDPNLNLIGWYTINSSGVSKAVGAKSANAWGLRDLSGNVLEWTWDWLVEPHSSTTTANFPGPGTGSARVLRGGAYDSAARNARAAYRGNASPNGGVSNIGFRLARSAPLSPLGGACTADWQCASGFCAGTLQCAPPATAVPVGYRYIPGGTFNIGSPLAEPGRDADEGQQSRTVSPFLMKTTEVTQGEWTAAGFVNPSSNTGCGATCPVERVNWWESLHYANNRSTAASRPSCYVLAGCNANAVGADRECASVTFSGGGSTPVACAGFRLPTEAEWEYAYRAGTTTAFYNGPISQPDGVDPLLDMIGWYVENSGSASQPVGAKSSNSWGLYDMAGNVQEWTGDWYAGSHGSGVGADWPGPASGTERVVRSGGMVGLAKRCRAARRNSVLTGDTNVNIGFRLARRVD